MAIDKKETERFEQKFNEAREKCISNGRMFVIELQNPEGEWEYGDVTYDKDTNKMSCMGVSIEVDYDFSVDRNLEALYEALVENGYS